MKKALTLISLIAGFALGTHAEPAHWDFAKTPPLGWNSWDIFGTAINEQQAREQADAMAEKLLPAGYDIFTVDIQWYQPTANSHFYDPKATLAMDEYGRLHPAPNRFPSAANGKGFKALADYVHSKGMRYGIHIMRGIPKQAVRENTRVLGTLSRAQDIAITRSTCPWNPDMYGVDARKPDGQAYYDSIIQMYADWGVDYIKCDDISRPYDDVQLAEIEALRKAIDKTGRRIVLSLSPGATPIDKGDHVMNYANLWRITDDLWDRWGLLFNMFERLDTWTPYRREGAWPDADMLPLGIVEFGRPTKLTNDEQYTMMTLWSIARSPLIFGGDMTKLDNFTTQLLTNPEMLGVNKYSSNNRQVYRKRNLIAWVADAPGGKDKYVALFNAQSAGDSVDFSLADYASPVIAGKGQSQEIKLDIRGGKQLALFVTDGNNGFEFDHAAWQDPILTGPKGTLKLTDLKWKHADSGWGAPHVNRTCEDQPLIINGRQANGIGTHANSKIIYDIPEGYDTFTTRGVMTNNGSVMFAVQVDRSDANIGDYADVSIDFADIGIHGKATVRDLWARQNIGRFEGSFSSKLKQHACGLYRISPE